MENSAQTAGFCKAAISRYDARQASIFSTRTMKTKVRATVVCARGDRVLLVSKDGSRWALPGGRPTKNETFADAAGRELLEETTLLARGLGFLFQVVGATTVHHVFVANIGKSAVPKPSKEIQGCQWFSQAELGEIIVSPTTRHIIESVWAERQR
ncbi:MULTISPECIES: NUDIX hydrolase [Cupriavidus]|jgi:8-oxo-dGTP diphosphatase|nr:MULTISPECIES: NUDIX hydrolase [Cupriavidus]